MMKIEITMKTFHKRVFMHSLSVTIIITHVNEVIDTLHISLEYPLPSNIPELKATIGIANAMPA